MKSEKNNQKAQQLSQELRNIGLLSARRLLEVGIDSLATLKEVGVEEAYMRLCAHPNFDGMHHAVMLYALEGAIRNCDWREIPEVKKEEYKQLTHFLRRQSKREG